MALVGFGLGAERVVSFGLRLEGHDSRAFFLQKRPLGLVVDGKME